ncbi:MAG: hypothetical protein ABR572_06610 [Cryomorphaceae bacterium]|nr:hypothetical protein [Flavobacteriales bacterium]
MQYIVEPIAALILWTFKNLLEPLAELPGLLNPNTIFIILIGLGLLYWLFMQQRFNKKADKEGTLK